jgi:hypothetical protein
MPGPDSLSLASATPSLLTGPAGAGGVEDFRIKLSIFVLHTQFLTNCKSIQLSVGTTQVGALLTRPLHHLHPKMGAEPPR